MTSAGGRGVVKRPWMKVHIISCMLAFFNLVAIIAGLALSQRDHRLLESEFMLDAKLGKHIMSVQLLAAAAADAEAIASTGLRSGMAVQARGKFQAKIAEFQRELARLKPQAKDLRVDPSGRTTVAMLAKLESGIAGLEANANRAFDRPQASDNAGALNALTILRAHHAALRMVFGELHGVLTKAKASNLEREFATANGLRRYGYAIGAMIAMIICCVIVYGIFIGHVMRQKYRELEEANARLEQLHELALTRTEEIKLVNENAAALNAQLAKNMQAMREIQEESIRKAKLAQLGQLTATVAHELRNPLGVMRRSVFLIGSKAKDNGLGLETQFERIERSLSHCDNIINQLLDFARSSALVLKDDVFDDWLAGLLEEEVCKLPGVVSVEFIPETHAIVCSFDKDQLQRAMINLLVNASEALVGRGGEPPAVAVDQPRIIIETSLSPRGVEISVQDNGPGIAAENIDKILQPLFTTKSFGTGLGLPAAEKIVRLHGGGLEVSSTPGHGACFTIWLPLNQARREAA